MNVLIADDEYYIRQRILQVIPWNAMGLEVVGVAKDGIEAQNIILKMDVDIAILDISMPGISGLDLASYLRIHKPDVNVIILTGYDDFNYAIEALKCKVVDYLLKPVETNKLIDSLNNCIDNIIKCQKIKEQQELYRHYEMCNSINMYMDGLIELNQLFTNHEELRVIEAVNIIGIYVEELLCSINTLIKALNRSNYLFTHFKETDNSYVLMFFMNYHDSITDAETIIENYVQSINMITYIVYGKTTSIKTDIKKEYQSVINALYERYYTNNTCTNNRLLGITKLYGDNSMYIQPSQDNADNSIDLCIPDIKKYVKKYILLKDEPSLIQYIIDVFAYVKSKESIDLLICVVTAMIMEIGSLENSDYPAISPINQYGQINSILNENYSIDIIRDNIIYLAKIAMKSVTNNNNEQELCRKIKIYINENYHNPEISVATIADMMQLSVSYLGSIFRKNCQSSIIQYITDIRMNKALELLEEGNNKIIDIASLVGYCDPYYFSKRFKQSYGISPKEYSISKTIYKDL